MPESDVLTEVQGLLGRIDIYLLDQALRGNLTAGQSLLDVGCGSGRNIQLFLRAGFDVHAIDQDERAVARTGELARAIAGDAAADHVRVARAHDLPYGAGNFDCVVCCAVLHFADNEDMWTRMVDEMWRVLKSGGLFFARLASSIGIEDRIEPAATARWYRLPDGTDRFLVDERLLMNTTARLGAELVDPIKTAQVQGLRSMTTWVLRKG